MARRAIELAQRQGYRKTRPRTRDQVLREAYPEEDLMMLENGRDPRIKKVKQMKLKKPKRNVTIKRTQKVADITDWMQTSMKPKPQKKTKKKTNKVSKKQYTPDIYDNMEGVMHDNVNPNIGIIEEKDEREEEDQTYTNPAADAQSVNRRLQEGFTSNSDNKLAQPGSNRQQEVIERRFTEDIQIEEEREGEVFREYIHEERVEIVRPQSAQAGNNIRMISSEEKPRIEMDQEEAEEFSPEKLDGNYEEEQNDEVEGMEELFNDIPVLQGDSEDAQAEFMNQLMDCIEKYQIGDEEQIQGLYQATAQKNPHVPEEFVQQVFEEIVAELNGEEGYAEDGEDDDDDHVRIAV